MPSINVTLKDNAPAEALEKAKEAVASQGGKVTHEYKLVKGFTAEFPKDKVITMQSNDHLEVEADGELRTQ